MSTDRTVWVRASLKAPGEPEQWVGGPTALTPGESLELHLGAGAPAGTTVRLQLVEALPDPIPRDWDATWGSA